MGKKPKKKDTNTKIHNLAIEKGIIRSNDTNQVHYVSDIIVRGIYWIYDWLFSPTLLFVLIIPF